MSKRKSSRKRLSDHLETEHDTKKSKYSECHKNNNRGISWHQYRYCSILPNVKELHMKHDISPHVKSNIDQGSYDSWEHYLNIHFNLLREDFVAPLRKAISNYKIGDESNIKLYHQAVFTDTLLREDGMLLVVKFRVEETSTFKPFINGTLLCFSSDNFKTILFATVVSQSEENQTERLSAWVSDQMIQVKVESDIDNLSILGINESGCILSSQIYTIIESPAHYETYYHVLKSLQDANPQEMPFTDYLISYRYKMRRPLYLPRNCQFDMSGVLKLTGCRFNIIDKDCWSSHNTKELDKSQVKALQLALTHEVALIQGPPGTGKTYMGGKIMEALLTNKAKWDPHGISPILVVCYTNHALDQFFEKIIEIKSEQANNCLYYHGGLQKELKCNPREIVRIGGGCSEIARDYSLKNLKSVDWKKALNKKRTKLITVTNDKHYDYLCAQRSKIEKLNKKINKKIRMFFTSLPTIKDLSQFIDPLHLNQLKSMHKCIDKCIGVWLQGKCHMVTKNMASLARNKLQVASRQSSGKCKSALPASKFNGMQYNSSYTIDHPQLNSYTKAEAQSIDNIESLSLIERRKLLNVWIKQFRDHQYNEIYAMIKDFNTIRKTLLDSRERKYLNMLQKAHVICMTTTGAAKHRHLLEKLKPKIVIAEEAAEVFESHIIACLTKATEHLILIGDHEQLQPNPSEHLLALNYKFSISLFERLIKNNIPRAALNTQHRMRPEIADLVRTNVYSDIKLMDDKCVKEYENIKGVTTYMYFFDHNYPEKSDESTKSYSNKQEGNFVAKFCDYLLKHYKPNEITVLTAYASQVKLLQQQIPTENRNLNSKSEEDSYTGDEEYVKVKTIDNYQGEENRIIVLSLVRSNGLGFMKSNNRTCVALSRAKEGLYCFGNFSVFSNNSQLWKKILNDLREKHKVGSALQLCCINHPLSITDIRVPKDFENAPQGGCWQQCNKYLDCGHRCMLKCHVTDKDHKKYRCKEPCLNKCKDCGEPCKHKCYIACGSQKCETLVFKTIPKCNHSQLVPCYMKPEELICQEKCNKTCFRGHPCNLMCSEECKPCMKAKTTTLLCGHKATSYCFENYIVTDCSAPCNKACTTNGQNPHRCLKRCSDDCGNCETLVEAVLPWCNHKCKIPCYMQHDLIFLASVNCTALVEAILPTCGHTTEILCGKSISDYHCRVPVTVNLPCGHSKAIECYKTQDKRIVVAEKCFVKVSKYFQKCKHTIELPCHNSQLTECPAKCDTVLLCGHKCSGTCHECHQGRLHKSCMFHVSKLLCGHVTTMKCSSTMIEPYPSCSYRCERFCSHKKCSHKCEQPCKPCHKPCDWRCTHFKCTRKCHENCNRQRCYKPCPRLNKCRHPCIGVCGERCPDVCKICDEEQFLQLLVFINEFRTKHDTSYIQLDCGHLFKRTELDPWVDAQSKQLHLISCPKCHQPIHLNQRRYANAIRRTYEAMVTIHHMMNTRADTNVKLEALKRYYATIKTATKLFGLSNLTTFEGVTYEELEEFDVASDRELKRFALACCNKNDTKFCQGIKKFIENKKENWLSTINVIVNIFDSILCLFKLSHSNIAITNCLEMLGRFILANHKSLSLQMIQDVTRECNRLAIWLMTIQLKNKTLNHLDLQIVAQVENVISPEKLYNYKSLLPQQAERLHCKLSPLAKNYGIDGKFISTTPTLPLVYTGRWRLCNEGHYYCIPEVSCDFLTSSQQCPQCSEEDDNDIIEY